MVFVFKDFEIPERKTFNAALSNIPGVGLSRAITISNIIGLSASCRTGQLNSYYFFVVSFLIKQYYGTDLFLKRLHENRLKGVLSFKSYKAIRYAAGLPVRGQHTHNNAKTAKKSKVLHLK